MVYTNSYYSNLLLGVYEGDVKIYRVSYIYKTEHVIEKGPIVYEILGTWKQGTCSYIVAKELPDIASTIEKLPAISIDHLGLSEDGLLH